MTDAAAIGLGDTVTTARARVGLHAMQQRFGRWLWVTDFAVVLAAVLLAQTIRFGELPQLNSGAASASGFNYFVVSVAIAGIWMAALTINASRSPKMFGNGLDESRKVFTATFAVFGVLAVVSILLKLDIARGYLAIALPFGLIGLLLSRWAARRYIVHARLRGSFSNAVLAVGNPRSVRQLAESFSRNPADGLRLVGAYGPGLQSNGDSGPLVFDDCEITEAVRRCGADTVVLTSGHLTPDEIRDLSWELEKVDVDLILAPGMVDVASPRLRVQLAAGQPLIHVEKPQYSRAKRFQKRAFDFVFTSAFLVAVSPVMGLAALAIKLDSRGQCFYLSERVGLDGQSFRMVKFRTMVVDAEARLAELAALNESEGGVLFKMREDPRITRIGKLLRRYSIDELPQFFNVLNGTMSVVGPRPPLPSEADRYDLRTRRRLLVRPGITGLWQISGRSDLSWDDSVRLDLSYVENWSMVSDLVIAMSTAKAVFSTPARTEVRCRYTPLVGYPDNVLAGDEQVVLHRHPHWKRLIGPMLVLLLATALASFAAAWVQTLGWESNAKMVVSLVILAIWLVVVGWLTVWPFLTWWTTHFVITDRRVMFRHGLLTRTGIDIPLARINSVEFRHGLFDRMLRTGTLIIESASQDPLEFYDIPRVEQVHALLYHEVFDTLDSEESPS